MNELKTLKDIDKVTILVPDVSKEQPDNYPLIPKVYVGYDESRQEAIKWIKELQTQHKLLIEKRETEFKETDGSGSEWDLLVDKYKGKLYESFGQIDAFMKFFNITEEELK